MRLLFLVLLLVPATCFGWGSNSPEKTIATTTDSSGGYDDVTYEGTDHSDFYVSGTSVRCSVPTGGAEGDLLICAYINDLNSATAETDSNWDHIGTAQGNNGSNQFIAAVYSRVLPASPAEYYNLNINATGAMHSESFLFGKTGGDWVTSVSSLVNADATSITTGSVTGYESGSLLGLFFNDSALTVSTGPTGTMTLITTFSSLGVALSSWYQESTTSTSYTKSLTWSATEQQSAFLIAIGAE